jgi:hypothetical protein
LRSAPLRQLAASRRAISRVALAIVLAGASGLAAGFLSGGALAAPAQDPPEPTTTIYATDPSPDPPPQPAPAPTPKPKAPVSPPPAPVTEPSPAPAPQPVQPAPVVRQAPAAATPLAKPKPQRKVVRKAPVKTRNSVPEIVLSGALGVSIGLRNQAPVNSVASGADLGSLLIVVALSIAIACFTIAVIPATSVPWRPAAIFVFDRQLDLTVIGFMLLMATSFIFFWTKAV